MFFCVSIAGLNVPPSTKFFTVLLKLSLALITSLSSAPLKIPSVIFKVFTCVVPPYSWIAALATLVYVPPFISRLTFPLYVSLDSICIAAPVGSYPPLTTFLSSSTDSKVPFTVALFNFKSPDLVTIPDLPVTSALLIVIAEDPAWYIPAHDQLLI